MILLDIYTQVSRRLNEDTPTFYPVEEIIAAINEGERLFCLLTLCLETTGVWTVAPNPPPIPSPFYNLSPYFADVIVPLRLADSNGAKIRPARLEALSSLSSTWPVEPGSPARYSRIGADLIALYPQPFASVDLEVTYARSPNTLASDADVPEIPLRYHNQLTNYAINRCRQAEGAAELAKTMPLLSEYLDAASNCAEYIRARNRGNQYDVEPFELQSFDRSQLLKLRKDLVPERRAPVSVE